MNRDELRRFAQDEKDLHDPAKQGDVGFPGRCAYCNFTRHPCSTYDLADELLKLLDEVQCICPRLEGADLNCPVHGGDR